METSCGFRNNIVQVIDQKKDLSVSVQMLQDFCGEGMFIVVENT